MSSDMMQFDMQELLPDAKDSETKKHGVKNLLNSRITFRLWQILVFLFVMTIIITVTGILAAKFGSASPCYKISGKETSDVFAGTKEDRDIDECCIGTHDCHQNATCINTPEHFNCSCLPGFTGDGHLCYDIDECSNGSHDCHQNATCANTAGHYNCSCQSGFAGNGRQCHDIDECSNGSHDCHQNATCANSAGRFNCSCQSGFTGNGRQCHDIDECSNGSHDCHQNATCINTPGQFNCSCQPGFTGDGHQCYEIICNFDVSMCGFVQGTNDKFDWTRHNGSTPSHDTGPSFDHTTGNLTGYYMYIEASSPRQPGDNAKLYSPPLKFFGNMCLQFYYHMSGATTESLKVNVSGNLVFSARGDKGGLWRKASVNISAIEGLHRVTFEGVVGSDYTGDIAIDDFSLTAGSCPYEIIGNFETICNFDVSMCGFVQGNDDTFDWTRHQGSTSSTDTGPSFDHTTGNLTGYYMYTEASSPRQPGDNAKLYSPPLEFFGNMCLQFYYHMSGATTGSLSVTVSGNLVFSASGNKGGMWLKASVDVSAIKGLHRVTFEAVVGSSFTGDIAIDDFSLTAGSCPDDCLNYQTLTSGDRKVSHGSSPLLCDNSLNGWYRFQGNAGTKMPTTCVATLRCGTHATGWLNGAHPTVEEGKVTRRVCFNWSWYGCCSWFINIEVLNCSGGYFLYHFRGTPLEHQCNLRYCGTD